MIDADPDRAGRLLGPPELEFFRLSDDPTAIVPARAKRAWMENTDQRYAYRCIPMTVANATGWELICPFDFEVTWDGRAGRDGISLATAAPPSKIEQLVGSHFGHGIITFHTGWLIRTSPGWATWVRGSPNLPMPDISALEGLVETDWLPFPFTMNWRFDRPGMARFEAGQPFCFVTPVPHATYDSIAPRYREIAEEPQLAENYARWQASRADFNARLLAEEGAAVQQGWERRYVQGNAFEQPFHITKRGLHKPV